ncbi:MAG TPA: uroporphyrinogen-III C-methyltransferase [Parafilimonas sp.]|nr:uroporphyrinogen-III C-methyltransferase [Parafilimonas sp.]
MKNEHFNGKVILASAGPGDPELITIKTANYLNLADVVLTDRLVSSELLELYVNANAEIVHVGKQAGRNTSTSQQSINELMVHFALQNKLVVRLKGGDTSVFSNVLDELEALIENNIPYEIIPGVTAALGAAAFAGIPLTARNYSNAVRFLTFYKPDTISEKGWEELAETDDTLVFYMSSEKLSELVSGLRQHGISDGKLLAVVEQATTSLQNVTITNLYEFEERCCGKTFLSPSLVIIGKVVALHDRFKWFSNVHSAEHYFKPLRHITLDGSNSNHEQKLVRC